MSRILFSGIALVILSNFNLAQAATVDSYWRNREGIKKLEEKAYYPSYQAFLKALESDPLNPELHLNLALTFEANEEWEKAEAAYRGALHLIPPNTARQFEALFNLANVLGKQRKIPEALSVYQQALDMVPDSKEIKTNIELLWQGGGGGGDSQNQDKNKSDKQQDKKQDGQGKDQQPKDQEGQDKQEKKPRPFKSEELKPEDVKKIMDEIKNQEQSIRANEYEHKGKEAPNARDW